MEYNDLKKLAEKFWEGESSETEEIQLREYLRWNEDIPSEFHSLRDYLGMMNTEADGLSIDFDQKVLSAIESKGKTFTLKHLYPIVAAAVVLFGVFFAIQNYQEPSPVVDDNNNIVDEQFAEAIDTYEDPEVAFEEVKKALMMISGNMNTGREYSNELGKFSLAAGQIQTLEN